MLVWFASLESYFTDGAVPGTLAPWALGWSIFVVLAREQPAILLREAYEKLGTFLLCCKKLVLFLGGLNSRSCVMVMGD